MKAFSTMLSPLSSPSKDTPSWLECSPLHTLAHLHFPSLYQKVGLRTACIESALCRCYTRVRCTTQHSVLKSNSNWGQIQTSVFILKQLFTWLDAMFNYSKNCFIWKHISMPNLLDCDHLIKVHCGILWSVIDIYCGSHITTNKDAQMLIEISKKWHVSKHHKYYTSKISSVFKVIQPLLQARTAISSFRLLLQVPVRQNANKY